MPTRVTLSEPTRVILRSVATKHALMARSAVGDRFLAKAVELPWMDSDPSVATLLQDDHRHHMPNSTNN